MNTAFSSAPTLLRAPGVCFWQKSLQACLMSDQAVREPPASRLPPPPSPREAAAISSSVI